jgi:carboxylesterase
MGRKANQPIFIQQSQRAILLLHAYTGSPNDFARLTRVIESLGYTVYVPVLSGHGTGNVSDVLQVPAVKWLEECRAAFTFLKQAGMTEVAVFGLSMGGIFATILMEENSEITGGGSFCTPLIPVKNKLIENILQLARQMVQLNGTSNYEQLATIEQAAKGQLADLDTIQFQAYKNLGNITQPYFLAQAGLDEMIDPTGSYATIKRLNKTSYTFQWYAKSGHVLTRSVERRKFEQDVQTFIESLPWMEEEHD